MTGPLSTNSERQSQHGQTQRCVGGHRLSQPTSQRISSQGREDERTMNDDARHLRTRRTPGQVLITFVTVRPRVRTVAGALSAFELAAPPLLQRRW